MSLIGLTVLLGLVAVAAMAGPVGWALLAAGLFVVWKSSQPK